MQLCAMCTYPSSRQSSPITVSWSSPVARCTLTYSRIVVRLPMRVYARSPSYFLSCDEAPIVANGKMLQSSPMLVQPLTTTCACSTVPRPTETFSPTMQYGPISTPRSILALGWTIAVGWITGRCRARRPSCVQDRRVEPEEPRIGGDGKHELGRDDELIVDAPFCAHPADITLVLGQVHFHHEPVPGNDGAAKFAGVDPRQIRRLSRELARLEDDAASQLRERFDHVDAGQERVAGKMSREDGLGRGDVLVAQGPHAGLELDDAIDQQNRIAVRQNLRDLPDVEFHALPYFQSARRRGARPPQIRHRRAMEFVSALNRHDFALRIRAEQCEVAEQVEHFVTDRFVGPAQILHRPFGRKDQRVLERAAARQTPLDQGLHLVQISERSRARDLRAIEFGLDFRVEILHADRKREVGEKAHAQ